MRVTPGYPESTHCQERFRNPPFLHAAVVCTQSNASDSHQSNIPERATGRRTSPIVHAYPTPHSGKTQCLPALHASTRTPPSHTRPVAIGTRLTDAAHPRCHAPTPCTHAVAPTPAAHQRRTSTPRMQARPEYARPRRHAVRTQETRFSAYVSRARVTPATRLRPVHMAWDREA